MTSLHNRNPLKNPSPHLPQRTSLTKCENPKNRTLKLAMTLSFFDQFMSPTLLGIPLIALALSLP
ncbi:hypothetical protein LDENG_00218960 [Lucifuga dentata]|nr:hypothetical protein LDENG_00218960 [Lucifuga dentata]